MLNDHGAAANNKRLRCGTRGSMTSPCHASAGTCSAINISLGVIYEYRLEGNALSTEHEKAIVFGRWTRLLSEGQKERERERGENISGICCLGSACLRHAPLNPPCLCSFYVRANANYFLAANQLASVASEFYLSNAIYLALSFNSAFVYNIIGLLFSIPLECY